MKLEYIKHLQNLCRISKKYYLLIRFIKLCKSDKKYKQNIKQVLLTFYKNSFLRNYSKNLNNL